MLRRGSLIRLAIIGFWLVMIAMLLQREVFVARVEPNAGGTTSYDTWMGLFMPQEDGPDQKVGFVHSAAQPETVDGVRGVRYDLLFKMSASLQEQPASLTVRGNTWIPSREGVARFAFDMYSDEKNAMQIAGVVEDGTVDITVTTANDTFELSLPLSDDFVLSGAMGSTTLNLPNLEIGDEVLVESFNPMTLSLGNARIKCIGETTFEFAGEEIPVQILESTLGGLTSEMWVTRQEEVVYVKTPLGMILRKQEPHLAVEIDSPADSSSMITRVAVQPTGKRPFRGAQRMAFTVSGLPPGVYPPSDAIQQQIGEAHYVIDVPVSHDEAPIEELDNAAIYLSGDPLVQVGHGRVVAQLEEILDGSEESWALATRLYEWVYEEIDKKIVLNFPSALEVIESREGDCNEHTVLYAALARTAGLPTRIAIGVVWSDELGAFYYHAWPEVHVGRWVPMDPTLGQPIADATHIKLLTGNIESWPQLVPYLGQLKLEILEIE